MGIAAFLNPAASCRSKVNNRRLLEAGHHYVLLKRSNAMNVRPLSDRILVKRLEEEEKTKGGIIIPDTAKEKPQQGKVVSVGTGKVLEDGKKITPSVKPGETVLFGKYAGTEIKLDGQEYLILREDDIFGVIE
jgi:chaperonin GroES